MPVIDHLLRLLLCLVLVFNGTGTSVAATRMAFEHSTHAAGPVHAGHAAHVGAMSHCPDRQQTGSAAGSHDAMAAASVGKHPSPDCCKSKCDCACVQATPAVFVALVMPPVIAVRAVRARAVGLAYLTPALPHLIRPPIG